MPFDFMEVLDEMAIDEEDKSKEKDSLGILFRGKTFLENGKFEEAIEIYRRIYAYGKELFEEDKNEYEFYVLGLTSLAEAQRLVFTVKYSKENSASIFCFRILLRYIQYMCINSNIELRLCVKWQQVKPQPHE